MGILKAVYVIYTSGLTVLELNTEVKPSVMIQIQAEWSADFWELGTTALDEKHVDCGGTFVKHSSLDWEICEIAPTYRWITFFGVRNSCIMRAVSPNDRWLINLWSRGELAESRDIRGHRCLVERHWLGRNAVRAAQWQSCVRVMWLWDRHIAVFCGPRADIPSWTIQALSRKIFSYACWNKNILTQKEESSDYADIFLDEWTTFVFQRGCYLKSHICLYKEAVEVQFPFFFAFDLVFPSLF